MSVVTYNFIRDARVFQGSVLAYAGNAKSNAQTVTQTQTDGYKTIEYKKKTGKSSSAGAKTDSPNAGIKVEVINYTSIRNLARDVSNTLKAAGYSVTYRSEQSQTRINTTILEKAGKNTGENIQKILKSGRVVKSLDLNSGYDVVLKLGYDYGP